MSDALEVVFRSFWTWAGTLVLVYAFGEAVHGMIGALCEKRNKEVSS